MGDVPATYATRKPRKPAPTLSHGELSHAGRYAASICRDLGGDPTMAEAALADLAGLWIVLAKRAVAGDTLSNACMATTQARACLLALGLHRHPRDVSGMQWDAQRPLQSTATVVPQRAVGNRARCPVDQAGAPVADQAECPMHATSVPPPAQGAGSAPATSVPALVPAGQPAPPAPTPTSAAPPARAHGGPGAQENRSHFLDPADTDGTAALDAGDLSGENGPAGEERLGGAVDGGDVLCPECQAVLVPARDGDPLPRCEACGWPPVEEAADDGEVMDDGQ